MKCLFKIVAAFALATAVSFAALAPFDANAAGAASLPALISPFGIRWGASPQEVQAQLINQNFKFLGPTELAGNPDHFLHEQRYEADLLGKHSDHVAPLFFGGRFFSLAVSYSPPPEKPATLIWSDLVKALTAQYGKPKATTRPERMVSLLAVLKLLPDSTDKDKLLSMYAAADANREIGPFMMQDLEVRVHLWVPEATWNFDHSVTVKAVMRAQASDQFGLTALKPAVIFSNPDVMK